ncbi:MAG: glycoside hydrolase family 88 protein [Tannerella sp.]|jgi:rhamnogalacturonyl hydrolase YesR|nr:glycoside hydrolase family 88 protein [Tannerella sp.]
MYKKIFLLLFIFCSRILFARTDVPNDFPKGYTPEEIGKRLAYHFVDERHELYSGKWIHYAEVCTWYGALKFAAITKDDELVKLLQNRFEPLFTREQKLMPPMNHVDFNMIGGLILELYRITNDKRYLDLGIAYADTQWEAPANAKPEEKAWAEKGYSWQTRLWIDDMYMITILQSQAYKVTGDPKYLDRAAGEMVLYLDEIQRPNGLFYHAPDVPYYWGRGDGWMAVGMTELLYYLPEDHKDRARILKGFHTMMESLKKYQMPGGMWNQLIDDPECWAETSATAMFTYAFIKGVQNGWLDEKEYAPAARKAWMAMIPYIDERNNVTEVCVGTGKKNDKQYYYDRPRLAGDFHGQAPYLWCAVALLENRID